MRIALASLIVAPLAFAAPLAAGLPALALAQSNPSADQIIKSLLPSGDLLNGSTRGIRPANTNATAATPQTTAKAADAGSPSVSLTVEFASGSAQLGAEASRTLDALGRALSSSDLANYHFRIEGHTDTVGSAAQNKSLSERRAAAVADYLEQHYGVTASRLQTVGMGEEGLQVPTPPQTPNAQNRRVKVVNLGA